MGSDFPTALMLAFAIFFFLSIGVLIVLWIALPLSVFGIKDLLRECLKELSETKEILKSIAEGDKDEEANEPDE
jgi:hypothetical protein